MGGLGGVLHDHDFSCSGVMFVFLSSLFLFSSFSIELNGLIPDLLSFVWFSLSHQGSRRRTGLRNYFIDFFYFVYFLQVKLLSYFDKPNVYRIFFSLYLFLGCH